MDMLKKIFPFSFGVKDITALVVALIIYIVGGAVLGVVFGLLAKIPLIGILFGIVGWAVGVYCFVGIVLAVLDYFNLIKQ